MSNVAVEKHTLDVLATAISNKSGVPVTMTLTEMVDAVDNIQTGGGGQPSLQTKSATYTPTTSQQTATITADSGYDGLEEVNVTVNAIPSNYVDTSDANATQNSLLEGATAYVNGAKITGVIPQMTQYTGDITQYFHTESNQRKWSFEGIIRTNYGGIVYPGASFGTGEYTYNAVPANTTITPTTSSQTVGGANYMMEGAVTVSAVPTGTAGTPTATKGSVSNHSVTVTPSVTNQTGYITGSTKTGTGVIVTASELVSGSETKTANGTYDVTNLAELVVNVSGGGASNFVTGTFTTPSTTSTNDTVTVPYTGTGYPIALIIFVEGGCYNSAISGWYNSVTRYAAGQFCITKGVATTAPSYGASGSENYGTVQLLYKNSTSSATTYSSTRMINANSYSSSNANGTSNTSVRWRNNTTISYRTSGGTSSTYGLLADTTYRYVVMYSQ